MGPSICLKAVELGKISCPARNWTPIIHPVVRYTELLGTTTNNSDYEWTQQHEDTSNVPKLHMNLEQLTVQ
jgi:hypothetical protein